VRRLRFTTVRTVRNGSQGEEEVFSLPLIFKCSLICKPCLRNHRKPLPSASWRSTPPSTFSPVMIVIFWSLGESC